MNYRRFSVSADEMIRPVARIPSTLCIELTTRCNGSCVYCAAAIERPESLDMDIDTFRYIVDSVPGKQAVWPVSFGESLLHPDIVDAVAYTTENGKAPKLITNGSLLSRATGRELLRAGLRAVRFSVEASNAADYNAVRPGLNWDTLVGNVQAFIQERDRMGAACRVSVRATMTGENRRQRRIEIKRFWSEMGCNVVVKTATYVPTRGDNERLWGKPYPCKWPLETLMVKATGDVVLCCKDWWGSFPMGSVHDLPPMEIFNGGRFVRTRYTMGTGRGYPSICKGCATGWRHGE